jgi:hypothetical protein
MAQTQLERRNIHSGLFCVYSVEAMVQKFELMSGLVFSFYIKVGIWHRPNWSVGNSWLFCVYRPMVQKFELMESNSPPYKHLSFPCSLLHGTS